MVNEAWGVLTLGVRSVWGVGGMDAAALSGLAALVLAGLAEWRHWGRIRRSAYLVYGKSGRGRGWSGAAGWVRALGAGALAWGLVILMMMDGAGARVDETKEVRRRLLICLDVSPSMGLKDAGEGGKESRESRARRVLSSLLERIDLAQTRVSVVAFYTTAKPVVVDTWDMNIVTNLLDDLPLEYAFKEGPTSLYAGVRESAALASKWPEGSTTLVVVSDGDTLPDSEAPRLPKSISSVLVIGVGSTSRGMVIAGRSSRQDSGALKSLASRLRGTYHDANYRHLPTTVLHGLWAGVGEEGKGPGMRALGLWAVVAGGGSVGMTWPMLAMFGMPRRRTGRGEWASGEARAEGAAA